MAFNSNTYHANKYRRLAHEALASAREIKARAARGDAYEWELPRVSHFARLARINMRISRTYRGMK